MKDQSIPSQEIWLPCRLHAFIPSSGWELGNKGRERLPDTAFKKPRALPRILLGSASQKAFKESPLPTFTPPKSWEKRRKH